MIFIFAFQGCFDSTRCGAKDTPAKFDCIESGNVQCDNNGFIKRL